MMDTEKKQEWCEIGAEFERDFVAGNKINGWAVAINPDKQSNPYGHDWTMVVPADLKTVSTAWRKSQELFGIPPDYAVSVNVKDFRRYSKKCPNVLIVIDARFSVESSGKYLLTLPRAQWLIENGFAKRHEYMGRVYDTKGNAKESYVFDLRHLDKLEEQL